MQTIQSIRKHIAAYEIAEAFEGMAEIGIDVNDLKYRFYSINTGTLEERNNQEDEVISEMIKRLRLRKNSTPSWQN